MNTGILHLLVIFYTFFKVGLLGFGGGYAMMSMIIAEGERLSVSAAQMADLSALDLIVPGPIAVNSATYVGYLSGGFWGSLIATIGVTLPSFFIVALVMYFIVKFRKSTVLNGILTGIKPAAVGLIGAAAMVIAEDVLLKEGMNISTIFSNPFGTISLLMLATFIVTAVLVIKFKVNPILLTVIAGVIGAFFG